MGRKGFKKSEDIVENKILNRSNIHFDENYINRVENKTTKKYYIYFLCLFLFTFTFVIINIFSVKNINKFSINLSVNDLNSTNLENSTYFTTKVKDSDFSYKLYKKNSENIDNKIASDVNEILSGASSSNIKFNYNHTNIKNSFYSLQTTFSENSKNTFKNYNFNNNDFITSKDIFLESKINDVNNVINYKIGSNESLKKYSNNFSIDNFVLKSKGINFYFSNSIDDYIFISYLDLNNFIKEDFQKAVFSNNTDLLTILKQINVKPLNQSMSTQKMVAFTFDDGPHPVYTLKILSALRKYNGHATFYMLGPRVVNNPLTVKEIVNQGSEVGNHSWSHTQLSKLGKEAVKKEIEDTNNAIFSACGVKPTTVRTPYGEFKGNLLSFINYPVMLWNIDSLDWKSKNKNAIIQSVNKNVKDGSIILMHDIYETSADAAVSLFESLTNQGYKLVTVSELFAEKGKSLSSGNKYTGI